MSFFYFLATQSQKPIQKEIDAAGLSYALEAAKTRSQVVIHGPDGQRGLVLSRRDHVQYKPADQIWHKITATTWIGRTKGVTITAGDLQRESMVTGQRVEMANGEIWLAAHARKFIEFEPGNIASYCNHPRSLAFVDGQWVPSTVQKRFRLFQELAEAYQAAAYDAVEAAGFRSDTVSFSFERLDDLAVMAITANYYASHVELSILEAYDVETRKRLVSAAMDEQSVIEWQKKRQDSAKSGSDLSDGQTQLTSEMVS